MKLRKAPLSEVKDLPVDFDVTEEMFEKSIPQLFDLLRKDGVPEEFLVVAPRGGSAKSSVTTPSSEVKNGRN